MKTFFASAIIATSFANAFDCSGKDPLSVQDTLDATRFVGDWYEQSHALNQPFQSDTWTCGQAQYSNLDTTDGSFDVYNSSESAHQSLNKRFGVNGAAKCPTGDGYCYVQFFGKDFTEEPNYLVLETDYDTHAIIYECDDMQYLWILAREATPSAADYNRWVARAKELVPSYDFNANQSERDTQGDMCTYAHTSNDIDFFLN
mmetsp:Transcript_5136/g.3580  ORF Transcript_5136/g.3580 Transcript_5136/m.3580 type:complete len:202 (-) Transcript_5136:326-931(-)|eukprot:CAMPEP_0116878124 /NCGR_PEP_ID=MMETSP0463-20121206/9853_1 /TAXON_ID=181622 /ORGANISM="Strombidinopsis sp, Strain SopsisLIS2011" /LENGTH=201 /DNA_ID=CAMNT_0004525989 /DNA_START=33 /DNA_END=638 /DNA_ORIENTATION=+